MNNAELLVELVLGNIEEKATGVFRKVLDNGREIYTCKCPVCGTLHGGFKTFGEAWANRKCREHFRSEIEKTKKDIQKVDEPPKRRDIFQQSMQKPTVIGEDEEDELVKELGAEPQDRIVYEIFDDREYFPVSLFGFIGRQGWKIDQFSGEWKVLGMTFNRRQSGIVRWPDVRKRLDAGESLSGFLWDVDHGGTRKWGRRVKVYKTNRQEEAIEPDEDSPKNILGPEVGWSGEVTKSICVNAHRGETFWHRSQKLADGSPMSVRVSGRCQTWETRPNEFRIPVKFGLYKSFYITDVNAVDWRAINPAESELRPDHPGGGAVAEGRSDFQPAPWADVE